MAGDGGIATQVFALAKDLGNLEKSVKDLGERDKKVQSALAGLDLGPVQEAIDHLEERTSGLQAEVQALAPVKEVITALGRQIKQIREEMEAMAAAGGEEKVEVWNWSLHGGMDKQQAADAWGVLVTWVRSELVAGYGWVGGPADVFAKTNAGMAFPGQGPMSVSRIPSCWYRHREAVIELSAICQEHIKIYSTSYGNPSRAMDWHDRAQNVKKRLITMLRKCAEQHVEDPWTDAAQPWTINTHKEGAPQATDDDSELSRYIQWDLHYRTDAPAPGPVAAS